MWKQLVCTSVFLLIFTGQLSIAINITAQIRTRQFSQWFNDTINNTFEYIVEYFPLTRGQARVTVISANSTADAPLMVVVRQQKEVTSWEVPLTVVADLGKTTFNTTSRMLCPTNVQLYDDATLNPLDVYKETLIISLSTASSANISFNLVAEHVYAYLNVSTLYNITVSPSEPRFYFYNFTGHNALDPGLEAVLLEVNSDDDVCTTVSIQEASCPVFDLNSDVTFEGYWETVLHKGGITIPKDKFPNGFFLVFVPKGDDSDCFGRPYMASTDRNTHITFIIKPSISFYNYMIAIVVTIACIAVVNIAFIVSFTICSRIGFRPRAMEYVEYCDADYVTTSSTVDAAEIMSDDISLDETEYDTIEEMNSDRQTILSKPVIYLSDLSRKHPRILTKKSYFYLWHVLTVGLFYGLPVIQLVITYQKVLNDTGNQDLCYYNFLCAHPMGFLSDFNHVFSNIGYIVFGLLFLESVRRREGLHQDIQFDKNYGIPQHFGLFYAMGVALFMEGVLSGSYHVCPNHSNFQFDSSFMYVMAVLCMMKLYQTRHPDINATAYATFGVLAIAILLGMIGILEATIYFWIAFTVLHLTVAFFLTIQVYYFGYWKLDRGILKRIWNALINDFHSGPLNMLKPAYKGRWVLVLLGNACNWALAIIGLQHHEKDFATYLLGVFMANTMLYFVFYVVMKLLHKERIRWEPLSYLLLATVCACAALYCFRNKSISWDLTPALSREYNQECKLLHFYDFHDIWHFLSALGMFFTFMLLLTLDDDLSHTHRTKIYVF